ncbi:MAG: alpha/beta hydrolase [Candidatus Heimdallarchaeota archaeon]|nr:alpha/beta hydrolase [Candidatus Heimdallarchaeota archaeon]MDH5646902.1 alpha/beta hydrolase [Candidatus Heimdallarchaeota archaeon]
MSTVEVNGITMYYDIRGEGKNLVFIHGLGSSTLDWEDQVSYFSTKFKTICIDLRGHGSTDKTGEKYSPELFAEDVAHLLNKLQLTDNHIVGLSLGGIVGFQLALDYPELVSSLTVINMVASIPDNMSKLEFIKRNVLITLVGMKKMGEVLAPKLFPKEEHEDKRNLLIERWQKNDKKAYLKTMNSLKKWNVKDRLGNISCNTLIVHAENDYYPLTEKQYIQDQIPNSKLIVIEDAQHAVNVEKPDHFNQILDNFLNSL